MENDLFLIPYPKNVTISSGEVDISKKVQAKIFMPECDKRIIDAADKIFKNDFTVSENKKYVLTTCNSNNLKYISGTDSYFLSIRQDGIVLTAETLSGFFYGIMTLTNLKQNYNGNVPQCVIEDWADIPMRSEYFDFRVIYPKYELLIEYIKELPKYKINTLFIEYEDKLPFNENMGFLNHPTDTFTIEQHTKILQTAKDNFVQVIPKQQCFGHLEYILKHKVYSHLRETSETLSELCPSKPESLKMITDILSEIIRLHPDSKYVHLGCDEVWSLGECDLCCKSKKDKVTLFIEFVNKLADFVIKMGKTPLIWHDMLSNATEEQIKLLNKQIVVCVWTYAGAYAKPEGNRIVNLLKSSNIKVFGAPSVRCWDGDGEQNYPNLSARFNNLVEWSNMCKEQDLECIIHTNWAVPFALGSPYGIFETTRYTSFFAADKSWNTQSPTQSYLNRFIRQYHGVNVELSYDSIYYYEVAPEILKHATKNLQILQWICIILQYELYYKRKFPFHTFMARHDESHFAKEIEQCLISKSNIAKIELQKIRAEMEQLLPHFMPKHMADLYIKTRFYLFDLYLEQLQKIYLNKEVN